MFHYCEATNWAVLPMQGGWYDQHPTLLDEWDIIFKAKAHQQALENQRRQAEMAAKGRRK